VQQSEEKMRAHEHCGLQFPKAATHRVPRSTIRSTTASGYFFLVPIQTA
jgi:hypothetical protein